MKCDPRTRLLLVFLISSAAVVIRDLKPLFALLLLTLLLCRLFSISITGALVKLKRLWYFFILLALLQSVFIPGGEVLLKLGGIRLLTVEGLRMGISIILRMAVIIYSALIIAAAPVLQVVYGLVAMKLPYEIAFMVLLALKFLPLFREEFMDSITAVQLAGADLARIPFRKRVSLYTYILMPAVVKALHRARYISLSMESRGFRAYPSRTSYCSLRMSRADYGVIASTAAAVGFIAILAI
ncbi:MAG TPA: energy-coupling factor transporter transmembrane component T [Negativicutes bacterium]|nr:energy-coupling factor transporter transmembrane component T [Negativicutes bacterium]